MTDSPPPTTGLHHVTNICTDMQETRSFYEDVLGFHTVKRTENYDDPGTLHYYFSPTPEGEPGTTITYFEYPNSRGSPGPGASHHFAMGVEDEETLLEWREHLKRHGVRVSPVRNRTYFESIYFTDPDGLVFELATMGPGFTVDEEVPGSEFIDPRGSSDGDSGDGSSRSGETGTSGGETSTSTERGEHQ